MIKNVSGFTLVEIAIVLVVIGLLLGGVVKGQEMIHSARVRGLISQQDGIKAAFFGFQDRYRGLPGDYAASGNIGCTPTPCAGGNANGMIEPPNATGLHEDILAWHHLSASGFLSGSFVMASSATATPDEGNTPKNAYLMYLHVAYDGVYGTGTPSTPLPPRHNVKTGSLLPVELVAEVDRKIDDGRPYTGSFQFSQFESPGGTAPDPSRCTSADTWHIAGKETNCGAVSVY